MQAPWNGRIATAAIKDRGNGEEEKLARAKLLAIVFSRREATHVVVLPLPFFPTFLFFFYGVCGKATVA